MVKPLLRVMLVDDMLLLRSALAALLGEQPGMTVVAEAADGLEAVEKALAVRPDLVLMDVRMPRCGGIEATARIKQALPRTRVVMLTVSDEDEDLFQAIKSGAEGYLLKEVESADLLAALRRAAAGDVVLSPAVAARVQQEFVRWLRSSAAPPGALDLTPREEEVLGLVRDGLSNQEIALRLTITLGTVKNHVHNILEKLHARNRAEAAALLERQRRLEL